MSGEMVDCHNLGEEEGCYWSCGSDVNDSPQHPRMRRASFHSRELSIQHFSSVQVVKTQLF